MSKKSRIQIDESSDKQKQCVPGPNVKFSKRAIPFSVYLQNTHIKGTLGCNKNQYPKYTNGKYCCDTTQATNQETFNYVNSLLESFIMNVSDSQMHKYKESLIFLLDYRTFYKRFVGLEDNLKIPDEYTSLEDWLAKTQSRRQDNTNATLILESDQIGNQNLEKLTERVLLDRGVTAKPLPIVQINIPSKKPGKSRSKPKTTGGKTRKKK